MDDFNGKIDISHERRNPTIYLSPQKANEILSDSFNIKNLCCRINLLSQGLSNTNYKLIFRERPPLVLRIYCRDASNAEKELLISKFFNNSLIIPKIYPSHTKHKQFNCSLMEFSEGINMLDAIQYKKINNLEKLYLNLGEKLNEIHAYCEQEFINHKKLISDIEEIEPPISFLACLSTSLKSPNFIKRAGKDRAEILENLYKNQEKEIAKLTSNMSLIHGDFKPANILVNLNTNKVSTIIDWEFAKCGPQLLDIATLFRYNSLLDQESLYLIFKKSYKFLKLPTLKELKILDTVNLCSLLAGQKERPKFYKSILEILDLTLKDWK